MTQALPARADVVVIGGGIIGCSVLYHLAKLGCTDAVLLERKELTSGTTWHSAALVTTLRPSMSMSAISKYSASLYERLEEETGQATGFRRCGNLVLAASEERLASLRYAETMAISHDIDSRIVEREYIAQRWPLLRSDDLHGGLWTPSAGRASPTDICQALVRGARAGGARVFENTAVEGFDVAGGKIRGVLTSQGRIECGAVVNCAGLWGRQVAKLAGVAAPLYACKHLYLLTEPFDGVTRDLPVVMDRDGYLYIREEVGGLLVGCFEPNPKGLPIEDLPRDSSYVLFDEDWEHFEPMMANAIHRIPPLAEAGARTLINGPESFTADHLPLLGESPEVKGFHLACGLNSSGVGMGGGIGWAVAEWVVKGRPPLDLTASDVRRHLPSSNSVKALSERIPEVLATNLEIHWPGKDYRTVRGLRRTPLHAELESRGAYFGLRNGWERAIWFDPGGTPAEPTPTFGRPSWFRLWAEEHRAAREQVALFDQSPFAKFMVQGADAEGFMQRVCANNMDVAPGKVVYTPLLNEAGGIESDLTVTRLDATSYLVVTGSGQRTRDADWLRRRMGDDERVTLTDVSSAYAVAAVTGPRSRDLLSSLSPDDWSTHGFPFGTAREVEVGYGTALALRVSYAGELGWELHIPAEVAVSVFRSIMEAGVGFGLRLAGSAALGSLRLEKGFRSWGHDVGPLDNPDEAGLSFAVSRRKPGFVGREAVFRCREGGVGRRLLSFTVPGCETMAHGQEPVFRNGERSGSLASVSYGHTLGAVVGLGWIGTGSMAPDDVANSRYEVEVAGRRYAAQAHVSAPHDPSGAAMRA